MKFSNRTFLYIFLLIGFFLPQHAWPQQHDLQDRCHAVSKATCDLATSLKRGINFGGMLDAPLEGDWGTRLDPGYIDEVAGKFQTVRIPIKWSNHASPDSEAKIDPFFLARVDRAVDAALEKGLNVIIDVHSYEQLFGNKNLHPHEFLVAPEVVEIRLLNIWRQLARHYKSKPTRLIFELLNEPNGTITKEKWNVLLNKLVNVVRETDSQRILMVGPTSWGASKELAGLALPKDPNIIATFHSYTPFNFTHQGVTWLPINLPKGVTCCSEQQKLAISEDLKIAWQWSTRMGIPVHLGEFGSYEAGDIASRAAYLRQVRSVAEHYDIGWAHWEFASVFGIYDPKTKKWREPLRAALLD